MNATSSTASNAQTGQNASLSILNVDACKKRLGERFRLLRDKRELTSRQLADLAALSQSRVVRIEAGQIQPTAEDVAFILDALEASPAERWDVKADLQTLTSSIQPGLEIVFADSTRNLQKELAVLAESSTTIRVMSYLLVPGLLQTAEYALVIVGANGYPEVKDINRHASERLQRQHLLFDGSKHFQFLMTEAALRSRYLDATGMMAQYNHIANLSSLPNVDIGILPFCVTLRKPNTISVVYDDRYVTFDTGAGLIASAWPEIVAAEVDNLSSYSEDALWNCEARLFLESMVTDLQASNAIDLTR